MAEETKISDLTWIGRGSRSARFVGRPFRRFIHVEAAGGIVLLAATITALVWANSPWKESYFDVWFGDINISIGDVEIFIGPVEAFVNDALMAGRTVVQHGKSAAGDAIGRAWKDVLAALAAIK